MISWRQLYETENAYPNRGLDLDSGVQFPDKKKLMEDFDKRNLLSGLPQELKEEVCGSLAGRRFELWEIPGSIEGIWQKVRRGNYGGDEFQIRGMGETLFQTVKAIQDYSVRNNLTHSSGRTLDLSQGEMVLPFAESYGNGRYSKIFADKAKHEKLVQENLADVWRRTCEKNEKKKKQASLEPKVLEGLRHLQQAAESEQDCTELDSPSYFTSLRSSFSPVKGKSGNRVGSPVDISLFSGRAPVVEEQKRSLTPNSVLGKFLVSAKASSPVAMKDLGCDINTATLGHIDSPTLRPSTPPKSCGISEESKGKGSSSAGSPAGLLRSVSSSSGRGYSGSSSPADLTFFSQQEVPEEKDQKRSFTPSSFFDKVATRKHSTFDLSDFADNKGFFIPLKEPGHTVLSRTHSGEMGEALKARSVSPGVHYTLSGSRATSCATSRATSPAARVSFSGYQALGSEIDTSSRSTPIFVQEG